MNPYDKYNAEAQLPRLTDDLIRGRLKKSFHASFLFFLFMLGSILLAAGLFTGGLIAMGSHASFGSHPAYRIVCWVMVAVIWLVAGSFIVYWGRDAWKNFSAYRAPYHIVKAELRSVSPDEFQGMVWRYNKYYRYREAVYSDEFCFDGLDNFPVSKSTSERAKVGDEYLIVVFDKHPTKPIFIFSAEAYRWP
jgi:hypothetical protein